MPVTPTQQPAFTTNLLAFTVMGHKGIFIAVQKSVFVRNYKNDQFPFK